MDDETDETIARIAAALRQMPVVDPAHKAGVLIAVAAERERARQARVRAARLWRVAGSLGVAAAAALILTVWWRDVIAVGCVVGAPAAVTSFGYGAPIFTHCSIATISSAGSFPLGGIFRPSSS